MKYVFILGRNIELSLAEVKSYFNKIDDIIEISHVAKNSCLVKTERPIEENIISKLGGVIGIAEVLEYGKTEDILKKLDNHELYFGTSNKLNYCLWDFSKDIKENDKDNNNEETEDNEEVEEFFDYLKSRFKKEKLKATLKRLPAKITLQNGKKVPNISSSLIEEEYVLFFDKKDFYFGRIIQKCSYEEIEQRDMNKPVRREELSISPRLSKILINLSEVAEGNTLVDPFCGIGVILSEALLQGIDVIGIDRDGGAIKGARENLEWFRFSPKKYFLKNGDSSKIGISKAHGIATEPDLGEILKKITTEKKAKETLGNFEALMINVINNLKWEVSGRIVFTAPHIRTAKKRLGCNIDRILKETGYKLKQGFPIEEFKHNQIVGRQIFVLYK